VSPVSVRHAAAVLLLALVGACGGGSDGGPAERSRTSEPSSSGADDQPESAARGEDDLRLNQLQALGTHNSYHVKPVGDAPESAYTHLPLDQQLDLGVRALELDIHLGSDSRFRVFHTSADPRSTCALLEECLGRIRSWSDAHPSHHPLFVLMEPKDDPETLDDYEALDNAVLAAFPRERLIKPDDVKGTSRTLHDAVTTRGWPIVDENRGRVLFVLLDNAEHGERYSSGWTSLDGRMMFVDSKEDTAVAAFFNVPDVSDDEGRIRDLVSSGFLVRTRADREGEEALNDDTRRLNAALRSGAHIVATDFPQPHPRTGYRAQIPGGSPSRCNPLSAPPGCQARDIEDSAPTS
jgi:hypothetical protein